LVPVDDESAAQRSVAHIMQLEVDRLRFSLTSYLKVRLRKIEKHARFIDTTPELHIRLSTAELNHLKVVVCLFLF
jgi:GINS complex subunit 4